LQGFNDADGDTRLLYLWLEMFILALTMNFAIFGFACFSPELGLAQGTQPSAVFCLFLGFTESDSLGFSHGRRRYDRLGILFGPDDSTF